MILLQEFGISIGRYNNRMKEGSLFSEIVELLFGENMAPH